MKETLQKLMLHETLSKNEARQLMFEITSNKANPAQIASLLTVFLMRPIKVEELVGFKEALLEMAVPISFDVNTMDVCGTGGDGKNSFNISTLTAIVVASSGIPVAKHGNYGVSSVSGSSNVLEYFGYKFTNDQMVLRKQLEENNICFLHAPLFHPALKEVAPIRKALGIKTFFNMLGPLVNPANPKNRLIGVYDLTLARTYNYLHQQLDINYNIVHSLDGFDEISLTNDFRIYSNDGEQQYSPVSIGFSHLKEIDLYGGTTIEEAAKIFKSVLENSCTKEQRSVVEANATFAISCAKNISLYEARQMACEAFVSGKALAVFKNLIE